MIGDTHLSLADELFALPAASPEATPWRSLPPPAVLPEQIQEKRLAALPGKRSLDGRRRGKNDPGTR